MLWLLRLLAWFVNNIDKSCIMIDHDFQKKLDTIECDWRGENSSTWQPEDKKVSRADKIGTKNEDLRATFCFLGCYARYALHNWCACFYWAQRIKFVMPLHGSVLSPRFDSTHIKDAKNKLRFFFGSWATKEQKHQLQSVTFVLSKIAF